MGQWRFRMATMAGCALLGQRAERDPLAAASATGRAAGSPDLPAPVANAEPVVDAAPAESDIDAGSSEAGGDAATAEGSLEAGAGETSSGRSCEPGRRRPFAR